VGGKVSPWKLGGLSVRELASRVWTEIGADEASDRAAALSYYFLFALFPALLFLTALLAFLPIEGLMDRLIAYLRQVLPGESAATVERTLDEITSSGRVSLLSVGALAALWAGSNGMASVISALNVAYDVTDTRPWWKRRLIAIVLTAGFSVFILLGLLLMVFGPKIGGWVAAWLGFGTVFSLVWNVVSVPIAIFVVGLGISLVYFLAPAGDQRWHWVTPGSTVALLLWLVMSFGLRLYVTYFGNYNATYGSIGGVILLMLWLYLTGIVLLLGAEVNSEIERARRAARTAEALEAYAAYATATTSKDTRQEGPSEGRPQRWSRGLAAVDDDLAVASRVVARGLDTVRREGWLPSLVLIGAAILPFVVSRRPAKEIAGTGAEVVKTGLQVAGAVAALERLRRDGRRR
jgi:membrane protein